MPTAFKLFAMPLLAKAIRATTVNSRDFPDGWPDTVVWTPLDLYRAGEQGVWYDPSDFSTMFQDFESTVPVTAVGQSVARIMDKSGNGRSAAMDISSRRPKLQQDGAGHYYLDFDGVDDYMYTNAINLSATDKMTLWAGVRKDSDSSLGMLCELSADANTNNGSFYVTAPHQGGVANYGFLSKGAAGGSALASPYAAPTTNILTCAGDISGDSAIIRVNGFQFPTGTADQGTGNYGSHPLYLGRRNGTANLYFNGRLYQFILRGAASNSSQITDIEAYVNSKTGAY